MTWLRQLAEQGATQPLRSPAGRAGGPRRAGAWAQIDHELDVIEQLGLPRLLPRRVGHRRVLPAGRHLLPGPRVGGQLGGLLRPRHHQGRRGGARPAVRALPVARARRPARHRHRHRERPPRRGHPVRLRPLRPRARGAGGQRHHLPGPVGGARHGQGPRLRHRPAGRVVQAGRRAGAPVAVTAEPRPTTTIPAAGARAGAAGRALPPPPRHPLGRHGHLRPAGDRGVPGRVGPHGGPHGAAVGQGRLRRGRAGEVRPARPRACSRALHDAVDLIREHHGVDARPGRPSPRSDAVYDMLCRADSVGVFQVESRAQMATLPRLQAPHASTTSWSRWRSSGPGPIQGGSVHPYIRRRNGQEPVTYLHPLLEHSAGTRPSACRCSRSSSCRWPSTWPASPRPRPTSCARPWGPSAAASGWSSCARGSTRGWPSDGITGEVADQIFDKLAAFANFGFPESHSVSLRLPRLRQRRGSSCTTRPRSAPRCSTPSRWASTRRRRWCRTPAATASRCARPRPQRLRRRARRWSRARRRPAAWRCGSASSSVRNVGDDLAERIVAERDAHGPYRDMEDLGRRVPGHARRARGAGHRRRVRVLRRSRRSALDRRRALWAAGAVAQSGPTGWPGWSPACDAPQLPGMSEREEAVADLWATGVSPEAIPPGSCATHLDRLGVVTAAGLRERRRPAPRCVVGGVVTHRQRPATAGGTMFINLEDETGPHQRGLLAGVLDPVPPRGPRRAGPAGPGPAREGRRGDQRGGREARAAAPVGDHPVARLPLTFQLWSAVRLRSGGVSLLAASHALASTTPRRRHRRAAAAPHPRHHHDRPRLQPHLGRRQDRGHRPLVREPRSQARAAARAGWPASPSWGPGCC